MCECEFFATILCVVLFTRYFDNLFKRGRVGEVWDAGSVVGGSQYMLLSGRRI